MNHKEVGHLTFFSTQVEFEKSRVTQWLLVLMSPYLVCPCLSIGTDLRDTWGFVLAWLSFLGLIRVFSVEETDSIFFSSY